MKNKGIINSAKLSKPANSAKPQQDFLWFIQFLRAAAAITVVIYHLGYQLWNDRGYVTKQYFLPFVENSQFAPMLAVDRLIDYHISIGLIAVAVFFLITGFVIPLAIEHKVGLNAKNFIIQKFIRIYPVHFATLFLGLITFLISSLVYGNSFPFSLGTITANALLVQDLTRTQFISTVLWTLIVDLAFYVIVGIFLLNGKSRSLVRILGISALLAAFNVAASGSTACSTWDNTACGALLTAYNITQYVIFILIGTAFYNYYKENWSLRKFLVGAGGNFAFFVIATNSNRFIYGEDTIKSYLIGLAIFVLAYVLRNIFGSVKLINFVAQISFALFLIHALVGNFIATIVYQYTKSELIGIIVALLVVVPISYLVTKYVEAPVAKFSKRFV